MPVAGLYLCGSGAHPGGGVTGVPGHNAAREIIRDFKGWRTRGPFVRRAVSVTIEKFDRARRLESGANFSKS